MKKILIKKLFLVAALFFLTLNNFSLCMRSKEDDIGNPIDDPMEFFDQSTPTEEKKDITEIRQFFVNSKQVAKSITKPTLFTMARNSITPVVTTVSFLVFMFLQGFAYDHIFNLNTKNKQKKAFWAIMIIRMIISLLSALISGTATNFWRNKDKINIKNIFKNMASPSSTLAALPISIFVSFSLEDAMGKIQGKTPPHNHFNNYFILLFSVLTSTLSGTAINFMLHEKGKKNKSFKGNIEESTAKKIKKIERESQKSAKKYHAKEQHKKHRRANLRYARRQKKKFRRYV